MDSTQQFNQPASRFCKPKQGDLEPTRFLYVNGVGDILSIDPNALQKIFSQYGELDDPYMDYQQGNKFCFIIYKNVESSIKAKSSLQDTVIDSLGNIKIYIRYAIIASAPQSIPEPDECLDSTIVEKDRMVPGLYVFDEFITPEEESFLSESLCGGNAKWETLLSRSVQHFGFEFNYRTLLLDYTADTPPMPSLEQFQKILSRIQNTADEIIRKHNNENNEVNKNKKCTARSSIAATTTSSYQYVSRTDDCNVGIYPLNQLTLNEYQPGQGIAHHVDSPICFGPLVCILSTAGDISMTFMKKQKHVAQDNSSASDSSNVSTVHMCVKRRSLMVFTGDARYEYTHGIASRRTDKYQGVTHERQRRVSLTFRQAIIPGDIPSTHLVPSDLEKSNVFDVYDTIANHWHHTRGKRKVHWHSVKNFIMDLPQGSLVADVGCGDGKYFNVNPDVTVIGCDRSETLLAVSRKESDILTDTFCCDAVKLPFISDIFDATLCIAVLHHISTLDRRLAIIRELLRITKPDGDILLQAWALEQDESAGVRHFDFASASGNQDVFVPWNLPQRFSQSVKLDAEDETDNSRNHGSSSDKNWNSKELSKAEKAAASIEFQRVSRMAGVPKSMEILETDDEDERRRKEARIIEEKRRLRGIEKRQKMELKRLKQKQTAVRDTNAAIADPEYSSNVGTAENGHKDETTIAKDAVHEKHVQLPHQQQQQQQQSQVLHRYCHVYKRGELEDLCSSVPNCRLVSSGYDKGNWFVHLKRVNDPRLISAYIGPPTPAPVIAPRALCRKFPDNKSSSNGDSNEQ